jgi:malate dehydrogenase (quinone)
MLNKANKALLGLALSMGLMQAHAAEVKKVDVLLVGGGIMSATLGTWLNELEPSWSMEMVERLDAVAEESSNGWNNAGTGHSALAESNYTPVDKDGKVQIAKAIEINEAFQISRQFWSWQVKNGVLKNPHSFINSTPHMSFMWGDDNIKFLHDRYQALKASPLFAGMEYSEDQEQIRKWVPLMIEGRDPKQKIAATWTPIGTDMNFGEITRQFVANLKTKPNFDLKLSSEVEEIKRNQDGSWRVTYKNLKDGTETSTDTKFLFIGAGGGALHLLQKSGIPEANDYAGFPVGGSFLVTENQDIALQHMAKAYGIASTGAAHVRAAPGYPRAGRQARDPVWPIRHLLDQVPEEWLAVRPADQHHHAQRVADDQGWYRAVPTGRVPRWPVDDERRRPFRGPEGILPERQERRLAPVASRPARADHQA